MERREVEREPHLQLNGWNLVNQLRVIRPIFLGSLYRGCRSVVTNSKQLSANFAGGTDKAVTANYVSETINWPTRGL